MTQVPIYGVSEASGCDVDADTTIVQALLVQLQVVGTSTISTKFDAKLVVNFEMSYDAPSNHASQVVSPCSSLWMNYPA